MKLNELYAFCFERNTSFIRASIRHVYYKLRYGLNIVCANAVTILNPQNIDIRNGRLEIGFIGQEFAHDKDKTMLYNIGNLNVIGNVRINKGSRICVTDNGCLSLNNCFVNSNVIVLCEHNISIGSESAIGWGMQIYDDDYHTIIFANSYNTNKTDRIRGGNRQ